MIRTDVSTHMGRLAERIAANIGLRFPEPRQAQFSSAIRRVMSTHRVDADGLLPRLSWDDVLVQDLVSELAIGETHFFRNAGQFAFIRDEILPELRRRSAGGPIHICSIGCSTGEEPYSLAILCAEAGLSNEVQITGFDIRRDALAHARLGQYGAWSLRNVAPDVRQRYFATSGQRFRLTSSIVSQVRFGVLDAATEKATWPIAGREGYDLVLCRNVLVYYKQPAVSRIGRNLFECLSQGGWLITAPVDPLISEIAPFVTTTTETGVVYRRSPDAEQTRTPEMRGASAAKPKAPRRVGLKRCCLPGREVST